MYCQMSAPGCRHHPSSLTPDTAALITHPCRPLQRQMVTLCCQDTLHNTNFDVLTEFPFTCLKTKFQWWNLRTFVFIEKVLANDHIIYITVRCKTFSHLNYGENFKLIIRFKCHGKYAFTWTKAFILSILFQFNQLQKTSNCDWFT